MKPFKDERCIDQKTESLINLVTKLSPSAKEHFKSKSNSTEEFMIIIKAVEFVEDL